MNAPQSENLAPGTIVRIVIFAHLAVAVPLAILLNVWADEASTLYTTGQGIGFALQNTLADEKQAPLYFWILSLWRYLDSSFVFARLFSVVFAVLAIRLFYETARRFLDQRQAEFVTVLFGLHPFLFWASLEIRVYSLVMSLSLALLLLWKIWYFDSADGRVTMRRTLILLGLSVVALYTNYYLGFLLAGLFAALVIAGRWRSAAAYFLTMIAAGICFSPLVWAMRAQFAANTVAFQTERSVKTGIQLMWNTFLTFAAPTEIFPTEEISMVSLARVWIVRIAIIIVIALIVRKRREVFSREFIALGAVVATITAFFLFAYMILGEVYVAVRHASVLFAPFAILLAMLLTRILPARVWIVALVVYVGLFAYSLTALYPTRAKRGDWARVGAYLTKNERPGQPIIVFTTFDALSLPHHYQGVNPILPDEKYFDWEIEAPAGTPEAWRRQTEFILSEIPPEADEIWLLTNEKCDVRESCRPLENFIDANYTIVEERSFYLEKVRLLRKKK